MTDKILTDTINFIKYFNEHEKHDIYRNELRDFEKADMPLPENNALYDEVKEKVITQPVSKNEEPITVKEISGKTMPLISENWMTCKNFDEFADEIKDCPKCKLLARTRKQVVFGTGNPKAKVVVVGEAPGADEDEQGKPFVGRAGRLLTDILKAINFTREEVFICNILKCRPPENRNPLPDEIANCEPYLFRQLEMIKPKLILAVGTFAAQTLLQTKEPLGKLRGKFHLYKGVKMMVTYHPAALLRNPNWKRPTWEDVQLFRNEYDLIVKN